MNCEQIKEQLTAYLLEDLPGQASADVREHLETCDGCRAAAQEIEPTLDLLRDALAATSVKAPVKLSTESRSRIRQVLAAPAPKRAHWMMQHHGVLAAAAGVLFTMGIVWGLISGFGVSRQSKTSSEVMLCEPDSAGEQAVGDNLPVDKADRPESGPSEESIGAGSGVAVYSDGIDVSVVKSPLVMKGLAASRTADGRRGALARPGEDHAGSEEKSKREEESYAKALEGGVAVPSVPSRFDDSGIVAGKLGWAGGEAQPPQAPAPMYSRLKDQTEAPRQAKPVQSASDAKRAVAQSSDKLDLGKVTQDPLASAAPAKERDQEVNRQLQEAEKKDAYALAEASSGVKRGEGRVSALNRKSEATPPGEELTGPRFKAEGVNPFVKTIEQAFSTFSIGVDTASYTLMRNYMLKGYLPPAESVRTEEFVNFFDFAYKAPARETFRIFIDTAPSKFGHGLQLMKIGVKGRRLGREEQRQARLTFLVDTSGSMDKPDRIGLVQKSLKMLVEKMAPGDLVALIQYDSHARLVLEFTPVSEQKKILAAIDSLQCSGSTNLEEGMKKAYELAAKNFAPGGESRVLLLSDGVANLGTLAAGDILKAVESYRKQGIFCSVFGVGMGTYDDTMLQMLAAKGDGTYAFLDSEEEARRVFVDDLSATLNTIAKDVKIQVEFNPKAVARFRQLGYESRQLKTEDFRNDAVDAGEVGSGQAVTALYEMDIGRSQGPAVGGQSLDQSDDRIATVRVRYRRVDNDQIEEIEQPLKRADLGKSFDEADVRFRLAACVAEFSEILRGSPFAEGTEFKDVADVLRPVSLELSLDSQVQELLRLIGSASGLARAPMAD